MKIILISLASLWLTFSANAQGIASALIVSGPVQNSWTVSEAPPWTNSTGVPIKVFKVFIAMLPWQGTYECGMVVRNRQTKDLMATGYWPSNGVEVEAGYWLIGGDTYSPYYFELPPGGQLSVMCYSFGGVTTASCEIWYTQ